MLVGGTYVNKGFCSIWNYKLRGVLQSLRQAVYTHKPYTINWNVSHVTSCLTHHYVVPHTSTSCAMGTHHLVMSHTPPHCHTHQLSPSMMANRMTMTKKKNVMSKISLTPSWSSPVADRITSAAGQEARAQQHTPHSHSHVQLHKWK